MSDLAPTAAIDAGEREDAPDKETDAESDAELLAEAKKRYKLSEDAWDENRKAWLEDIKFSLGDHWPEKIKAAREKAGRPVLVVDKLNQYRRQVVNDGRQNRPAIKIRPVDGGDEKVAEAYQGIIRSICNSSNVDAAFDTSLDHAVGGGFGYFRVLTEYAHKGTFNQDICIKRVRNPLAVLLDPNFQEADGSDANWGFFTDEIPKDEFKRQYPKAKFTDWESDTLKYSDGWMDDKNVRVCEYWYKVETPVTMHLLGDGTTVSDEEYQLAVKETGAGPVIVESREIPDCKVKWCRMTGAEILEKSDWLGKYIPIIPVFGSEQDVDGKVVYSGLIRPGKDAQRLYDFSRSAFAERVALTPKAPNVAAAGQVEGHPEWQDANTENYSVLVYDPIDVNGTPLPPPQRQPASDIPEGFSRDMQLSEHDIQGALGMYNASLGEKSNEKSGKAIMARQREGDTGTFHYIDNLGRAICYLGQLVDLIPKVYDSRRVVRILGEDGTATTATIDPNQQAPHQNINGESIYNLGVGTYDVAVSTGPSYTTKRQEAAEAMMQLVQSAPQVLQFAGDLLMRNLDWEGADELADRFKLMLPPPIAQAELAKAQGQDPKIEAATAPLKQGLDQAHQQIQAAEAGIAERDQALQKTQQELDSLKAGKAIDAKKVDVEMYKAETDRMQVLAPAVPADQVALIVQQTVQEIMNQPVNVPPNGAAGPPLAPPPQPQPAPAGFLSPGA